VPGNEKQLRNYPFVILILYSVPLPVSSQEQANQTGGDTSIITAAEGWDTSIITAVSVIGGALAGGFFTYWAAMRIEDRKDRAERENFERFRKGLVLSIDAELNDYKKFLDENLVPEHVDSGFPNWAYIDEHKKSIIEGRLNESLEYGIMRNTAFEQRIRTIEPELLIRVFSAYRIYDQTFQMIRAQIEGIDRGYTTLVGLVIPLETLRSFNDTLDDISTRISALKWK
jgi:hypothetical protein